MYGSSVGVELNTRDYWSSTEYSYNSPRPITYNCQIGFANKPGQYYVRAFLRAGGTSKISLKVI